MMQENKRTALKRANSPALMLLGLPNIVSIDNFAMLTHISPGTIFQLSQNADKYYREYTLPKKSGGERQIAQPSKKLKAIQSWILHNILYKLNVSDACKGFRKGTNTLQNAEPHKDSEIFLTIDLKDFFSSIERKKVFSIFHAVGYNSLISQVFTNLCTFQGILPQGSPCSPMLANLTSWKMDVRILGYVGRRGITYTRYADDMTFSASNPHRVLSILPIVKEIIESEGHSINETKTRIAGPSKRKLVTGLVISNGLVGIGAKVAKNLRAKIHHLAIMQNPKNQGIIDEVDGWFAYLNSVDKPQFEKMRVYAGKLLVKFPNSDIRHLNAIKNILKHNQGS